MPRPIAVDASVTVSFPPEQLWPFVADTNRMDRVAGLPPADFTHVERTAGGEEHWGEYRLGGRLFARWKEHPFEWERPRRYAVLRDYARGPLLRYYGGAELTPVAGGTRIRVFSHFTPRHPLLAPMIRAVFAPVALRRACREYRAIAAFLAGQSANPFPSLVRARSSADVAKLDAIIARLADEGVSSAPLAQLRRLLVEGEDEAIAGMRPFELAGRWGTNPNETVSAFLRATVAGLLELRWELLCPSCRGVKATSDRLRNLPTTGRCPSCNLHIIATRDESIEARFYPVPAIRAVSVGTYCVGGPLATPHRLAQVVLRSGESRRWQLTLPPGNYILRSAQSRGVAYLMVESGGAESTLRLQITPEAVTPHEAYLSAGPVSIALTNGTPDAITVAIDDGHWWEDGATPARLMTVPAFRALFSAEALAPGVELAVRRAGLLFTDLAGSTALYERVGDARAFRLVGEHFILLRNVIEAEGGALVKTIGDATMAGFPDGRSALAAALAIQRAIRELDGGGLVEPTTLIKIGVHAGACYAVTLNERLDYFGATVNLASRAQHMASGGEIVATDAVFHEAGVSDLVAAAMVRCDPPFAAQLRGLSAPVHLYRLDCRDSPEETAG